MFEGKWKTKKHRGSQRLKALIISQHVQKRKTYQTAVKQICSTRYNNRALFKERTSRAFSAFVSVITPTAAFAASIINMTFTKITHPVSYCLHVTLHTSFPHSIYPPNSTTYRGFQKCC
jgi:hypothetical protein